MLDVTVNNEISVVPVSAEEVAASEFESAVGHQDTANVLSAILGKPVPMNRVSLKLDQDTVLYVAQVTGGRLPEGATTLPEGMKLCFLKVTIK
jgi:hypothetical protein